MIIYPPTKMTPVLIPTGKCIPLCGEDVILNCNQGETRAERCGVALNLAVGREVLKARGDATSPRMEGNHFV